MELIWGHKFHCCKQSLPKTIELTGHLGQWQALIYWPKPGFTGPNNWHNTMSTKFPHASRASGRALFTGPIGNWLANGVGPVLISQTGCKVCAITVAHLKYLKFISLHQWKWDSNLWTQLSPMLIKSHRTPFHTTTPLWKACQSGVGVTKPISSIPVFSELFSIIKTHIYWRSHLYLTGVTAAQLRWHLSNINVIQII